MSLKRAFILVLLVFAVAAPAFAQPERRVAFNGFGFNMNSIVGENVVIVSVPADPPALEQPGGPVPAHTRFDLFTGLAPVPQSSYEANASITVFRVSDLDLYPLYQQQYALLQALLDARPDLSTYQQTSLQPNAPLLPYVPVTGAVQVLRARAKYMDTALGGGISFVTVYRQDAYPFRSGEFEYTYQGISAGGTFYISALFKVNAAMFPADVGDFNYDNFIANYESYLNDSLAKLNAAVPTDFQPSLADLDALIGSMSLQ